jgi:hypothetical protein
VAEASVSVEGKLIGEIGRGLMVLLAAPSVRARAPAAKLTVDFFGSRTCRECLEIREEILLPLAEEYPGRLFLRLHYIEDKGSLRLMDALEKRFGVTEPSPQELFLPDTCLLGAAAIMESGEQFIRERLDHPELWKIPPAEAGTEGFDTILKRRVHRFTFLGILAAGLVDGVNPCAIATMIFLISFLAARNYARSEILTIGLVYTGAVYVTYLLLGLGAFQADRRAPRLKQVTECFHHKGHEDHEGKKGRCA